MNKLVYALFPAVFIGSFMQYWIRDGWLVFYYGLLSATALFICLKDITQNHANVQGDKE